MRRGLPSPGAAPATLHALHAGLRVRRGLAQALRAEGRVVAGVLAVMTGEVAPSGVLVAASGETSKHIGIDGGLFGPLSRVYDDATAAGTALQVGRGWAHSAGLERASGLVVLGTWHWSWFTVVQTLQGLLLLPCPILSCPVRLII